MEKSIIAQTKSIWKHHFITTIFHLDLRHPVLWEYICWLMSLHILDALQTLHSQNHKISSPQMIQHQMSDRTCQDTRMIGTVCQSFFQLSPTQSFPSPTPMDLGSRISTIAIGGGWQLPFCSYIVGHFKCFNSRQNCNLTDLFLSRGKRRDPISTIISGTTLIIHCY